MSNIVLDKNSFYRRIKRLYDNWKKPEFSHDDSLQKVDCILTAVGEVHLFPDQQEEDRLLEQIEKNGEGTPSVKLLVRDKNEKDKVNFQKLLEAIKGSNR